MDVSPHLWEVTHEEWPRRRRLGARGAAADHAFSRGADGRGHVPIRAPDAEPGGGRSRAASARDLGRRSGPGQYRRQVSRLRGAEGTERAWAEIQLLGLVELGFGELGCASVKLVFAELRRMFPRRSLSSPAASVLPRPSVAERHLSPATVQGPMELVDKYRRYADECRRIALATHLSDDDRALLLEIARDW